jgi:hypothetical protein
VQDLDICHSGLRLKRNKSKYVISTVLIAIRCHQISKHPLGGLRLGPLVR